jgi:hypothetical protein
MSPFLFSKASSKWMAPSFLGFSSAREAGKIIGAKAEDLFL